MDKLAIIKLVPLLEFSYHFINPFFLCTWLTSLIIHQQREKTSDIYSQYLTSELTLSTIIILVSTEAADLSSFGKSQSVLAPIRLPHTKLELFQKKETETKRRRERRNECHANRFGRELF